MSGKAYAYSLIFEKLTPPEISIEIFFRKPLQAGGQPLVLGVPPHRQAG